MRTRLLVCLVASLTILTSVPVFAQEPGSAMEIKRLQILLSVINSELKADLDQILTLHEALKANARTSLEAGGQSPDVPFVADVQAAQRRAIARESAISARLDAIVARSVALDASKQPLLERIRELSVGSQPIASPAPPQGSRPAVP
jgi:hypothetical protein